MQPVPLERLSWMDQAGVFPAACMGPGLSLLAIER